MEYHVADPSASAEIITKLLYRHDPKTRKYNIVLSGGRSIIPVLHVLKNLSSDLLTRLHFYLADERIGGEYNQAMLMENAFTDLLSEKMITPEQLIFPDTTLDAATAAAEYEKQLKPFTLAFLGVGEDGHVASLFPRHPALTSAKFVEAVHNSPKPPPERVTLTFRAFSRETVIILFFFGTGKREAYVRFSENDPYMECPAAYFKNAQVLYIIHNQGREE